MTALAVRVGELRHRIVFLRGDPVDDGLATVEGVPLALGARRAKKIDVTDVERVRAGELGSELTARFIVRADAMTRAVRPQDRILRGDTIYWVIGVRDPDDRDRWIEISVTSRADAVQP